jgi:hypothetical protein
MRTLHSFALAGSLLVMAASAGAAQTTPNAADTAPAAPYSNGEVVAAAMGGSLIGLFVGLSAPYPFLAGGSEEVLGVYAVAILAGSAAGTAIGIRMASRGRIPTEDAIMGGILGAGAGMAAIWMIDKATHSDGPAAAYPLGFSISQGALASAVALGGR